MADVTEIISSIKKPLAFASKDRFAHVEALKGLEPLFASLLNDARSTGAPDEVTALLERLTDIVSGFDAESREKKVEMISRALDLLDGLSVPVDTHPGATGVPRPPSAQEGPTPVSAGEARRRLAELGKSLEFVKGIGPKLAERLSKKGLRTVEDLLFFLPIRYEDRSSVLSIKDLSPGHTATITATVLAAGEVRYGRRRVYEVAVGDDTGILKLKWFNFKKAYMQRYKQGQRYTAYGTVSAFGRQLEMIHPDMELADSLQDSVAPGTSDAGIVPVYSQIDNLHQKTIRKIVRSAVDSYSGLLLGGVPAEVLLRNGFAPPEAAIRVAHQPCKAADAVRARSALAFDELFTLELGLAVKRGQVKKEPGISHKPMPDGREARLKEALPFSLTGAQERCVEEIFSDMAVPHPMNRLIQGDVGSGKTVVSLLAALRAVDAGYQAAIMAPTEILAEQHYLTTHRYAEAAGVNVILLTGNLSRAERGTALGKIASGEVDLVVGTHALIQKDVEFASLGLAVIDEQHRFGVMQRAALKKKGSGGLCPDVLIMTATPIPRTMSMTVFGDLDVSTIDELPPGRLPVKTILLREKDRARAYAAITEELKKGAQAYVVYPLVEESEELPLKDATNMADELAANVFGDYRVGLIHGRMKSAEKEEVMRAFKAGELDVLVATTVIEVGVDVPNCSVILIEHAERFGLAQLHQLRGRVGRGQRQSLCILLAQWTNTEETLRRLKVMVETEDGFKIAEEDLKLRGPGDFIGTRQAGFPDFRISGALGDLRLLKTAREEAFGFISSGGLKGPWGPLVREVLKARWEDRLELAEIG